MDPQFWFIQCHDGWWRMFEGVGVGFRDQDEARAWMERHCKAGATGYGAHWVPHAWAQKQAAKET